MHFAIATIAAAAAFFSTATAHTKMVEPIPFNVASLDNGPLKENGQDFPCKVDRNNPVYLSPGAGINTYTAGGKGRLSIMGSAVHGGGSCQISLTEDKEPTPDSKWKVIHSIEGGCPANTAGNLGDNPSYTGNFFEFPIPESIAPGEYTLAWTWLNRIGNRELYMNCAPVTIKGAAKKRYAPSPRHIHISVPLSKRQDFPDLFVANIAVNGQPACYTRETVDIRFPNPGQSVQRLGEAGNLLPSDEPVCKVKGSEEGPTAPPYTPGGSDEGQRKPQPGNFAPVPSQPSSPEPATTTTAPPPPPPPAPENQPEEPPAPENTPELKPVPQNAPSGGDGSALSGACNEEGIFNCIGGTSFQQCASGQWSAAQPVAAGTRCQPGQSADLGITHARRRRHIHERRAARV